MAEEASSHHVCAISEGYLKVRLNLLKAHKEFYGSESRMDLLKWS